MYLASSILTNQTLERKHIAEHFNSYIKTSEEEFQDHFTLELLFEVGLQWGLSFSGWNLRVRK